MKKQASRTSGRSSSTSSRKPRTSSASSRSTATSKKSGRSANTTNDHDEIQHWAEARGGVPACVKRTGKRGDMGVLRIDFPGRGSDEKLQQVSWDEWFQKFDSSDLAFLYQDKTATGRISRFNKLVSAETAGSQRTSAARKPRTRTAGR